MPAPSRTKRGRWGLAKWLGAVWLVSALIGDGAAGNVAGQEQKKAISEAARQLAADVVSPDKQVRQKAFRDLINGNYRALEDDERLAAVMPAFQTPDLDPDSYQGFLMGQLPQILGSKAKDALPTLLDYMANEKITLYLRGRALFAAARIGSKDQIVVAAIMKVASSSVHATRELQRSAIEELGKIGQAAEPSLPMLREHLTSKDQSVQDFAMEAIGRIMLAANPEREFAESLTDKDPAVRAAAHEQIRLRAATAEATAKRKTPQRTFVDERSLTVLLELLEAPPTDFDRNATLKTLCITGPGGNPRMIKVLLRLINVVSFTAEQALARLDPSDPAAIEVLLESLRRTNDEPRGIATMAAVHGLQQYGAGARPAVPDLVAGYDRLIVIPNHGFSVENVRDYLATMVAADPTNVAVISRVLDVIVAEHPLNHPIEPFKPVAPLAMEVLATIGLPADPELHQIAVNHLAKALTDPNLAGVAAKVLEKTDPAVLTADAAMFIPLLVKILETPRPRNGDNTDLQNRNGQTGMSALRVLARFGPAAQETLPLLKKLAAREIRSTFDMHDMWEGGITKEARKTITAISMP